MLEEKQWLQKPKQKREKNPPSHCSLRAGVADCEPYIGYIISKYCNWYQ